MGVHVFQRGSVRDQVEELEDNPIFSFRTSVRRLRSWGEIVAVVSTCPSSASQARDHPAACSSRSPTAHDPDLSFS